jgi:hypothetical protein
MVETRLSGDPHFERWISPSQEELEALSEKDFLSNILQRTAPPPKGMTSSIYHIGSLGTLIYMQGCNGLILRLNESKAQQRADRAKVGRVCKAMKSTFAAPTKRLRIPVTLNDYFLCCAWTVYLQRRNLFSTQHYMILCHAAHVKSTQTLC